MNIGQNNPLGQIMRVYRQQEVHPKGEVEKAQGSALQRPDSVEISAQGQEIARIKQAIDQSPELRTQLVAELKAKIEAGTYDVPAQDIARAIIEESALDGLSW